MKKYQLSRYDYKEIVEIEIASETEHFVTLRYLDRYSKNTVYRREKKCGLIYDTWEDARHALVMRTQKELEQCEHSIARLRERLRVLDQMVKP